MVFTAPFSVVFDDEEEPALFDWWEAGGLISPADCVVAYSPWNAADFASSKINLNNPGTHDAGNGVVVPLWDADGWKRNGSSYLTTDIIPVLLDGWSMMAYFTDSVYNGATRVPAGMLQLPGDGFYVVPRLFGNANRAYQNGPTALSNVGIVVSGTMGIGGGFAWLNGVSDGVIVAPTMNPIHVIALMARNLNGTYGSFFDGTLKRLAIYKIPFTPTIAAALDASMRVA